MKTISEYNNVLLKGNVNREFYLYNLNTNFRLIKYAFYNIVYLIISIIFKSKKDIYEKNKFKYLRDVKNLDDVVVKFYKKTRYNSIIEAKIDVIIDKVPIILIPKNMAKTIIGYEFDKNFVVDIEKYNKKVLSIKKCDNLYVRRFSNLKSISCDKLIYAKNNKLKLIKRRIKVNDNIKNLVLVFFLSILLTIISFFYTRSLFEFDDFFKSYFSPLLFLLNFLPIFLLMLSLSIVFKRTHISLIINSILILVLGISNQTKLLYRDDIVKFEDISIVKEALIMSKRYDIVIKKYTIIFIFVLLAIYFLIKNHVKKYSFGRIKHLIYVAICLISIVLSYNTIYKNEKIYQKVGDKDLINVWITTRQYQIRGLIYPFIYTIKDSIDTPPKNYDKTKAQEILNTYTYDNIDEEKKVNIIAVMLEAYNDFSKFETIDFSDDIYEKFHSLQAKSISGNLVTEIFGGGTIDTERKFITGYENGSSYRKQTNSYVWYFKEQGYITEAMHPIYGAFYNRASVNINLGFDKYYYYENTFSKMQSEFMDDNTFFDQIIAGYEKAKKKNLPYFNFSVTYQNHGPYWYGNYDSKEFFFNDDGYDEKSYNTINEYFSGIKKTNDAIEKLVNYFENEDPTIIIFFGDHNPYLGEGNLAYNEFGINIDLSTVEGFENYYETPYIIYANNKAKKMFNNDFVGKGETISPIFLMNVLFSLMDESGNEYLQYMQDLKSKIDVIGTTFNKENNKFVLKSDSEYEDLLDEYFMIDYYYSRNFKYRKNN